MKSSELSKYHRTQYGRYKTEGTTIISSVEIENDIVGVWLAIVIVLKFVVCKVFESNIGTYAHTTTYYLYGISTYIQ